MGKMIETFVVAVIVKLGDGLMFGVGFWIAARFVDWVAQR